MFTTENFTYVLEHGAINIHSKGELQAKPLVSLYQVQVNNPEHMLTVGDTKLKLEADYHVAEPTPDVMARMLADITNNIAPYLEDGVITTASRDGDITITSGEGGVWFLTRGKESVTLNNQYQLPEADAQYWVAYASECGHCGDGKGLVFEFVGVDSCVLDIPAEVSLSDHLLPFVQAMENRIRQERGQPRFGLFDELFGGDAPRVEKSQQADNHFTVVRTVVAGAGKLVESRSLSHLGGIEIDGVTVLDILSGKKVTVLGEPVSLGEDEESRYSVSGRLLFDVSRRLEKLSTLELNDGTFTLLSAANMQQWVTDALTDKTGPTGNKAAGLVRQMVWKATIPGKSNYWLRPLVNIWFMRGSVPDRQLRDILRHQLDDLAANADVDESTATVNKAFASAILAGWESQ